MHVVGVEDEVGVVGFVAIDVYEGDRENSRGAKCEFGHSYVITILKYSSDIHKSKSWAGFDSKRSCYCGCPHVLLP